MNRWLSLFGTVLLLAGLALQPGCGTIAEVAASAGEATGAITPEQGKSIKQTGAALDKAAEAITPEQEYYIGRTVAATIISTYKPYNNEAANRYLNLLGQSLAQASDRPETFKGYRFLILETDEVNAFAAPSGLILVSRGMIRCCKSEDALAAVLAHEVGHVQLQHGLKAIKKGRLTGAVMSVLATGARLSGQDLAQATDAFEGCVNDIATTMINNGYSRSSEREADKASVTILKRVGYNPSGLTAMLQEMEKTWKTDGPGFSKTHPRPGDRIRDIEPLIGAAASIASPAERQTRFNKFLASIR